MQDGTSPRVTLIVPMRNEEAHIAACLRSIIGQDVPPKDIEVLVYDGGSSDRSRAIATDIATRHASIVVLDNLRRTQAAAWNQGIDRARGDVIGIVSAHAELAPDYVRTALVTLERTGADMVGGPMRARGEGPLGRAVAAATSSRFGVGGAAFHYTDVERDVDTVYMGLAPASVYRSLRFDETMVRNQDDELSYRLLDRGGRIVCDPAIRSRYHNRATWSGLARQYFEYGWWKVLVMERHPRQVRPRHLIPAAFVGALVAALALAPFAFAGRLLLGLVVGSYAVADASATVLTTRRRQEAPAILVAAVFATLHVAYGAGVWVGLGQRLVRRGRKRPAALT
jgi:glycosyltransferase involved in cell wall biosynthesis